MARQSKLTPEQWELARRRWEGSDAIGFTWLSREIAEAWGVEVNRKSLEQAYRLKGWEKGGEPSKPLQPAAGAAQAGASKAPKAAKAPKQAGRGIHRGEGNIPAQQSAPDGPPEVADEVVAPKAKPPGYAGLGRPTLYREEYAAALVQFFDAEPFTEVQVPQPNGSVRLQRMATDPPMLSTFARTIGVSRSTLDNWATALKDDGTPRHPEFFEAYARAREMQEALLARGGVLGLYDPRFLAMAMKNLCGWQDQPQQKVDVAPVSKDELEAAFVSRMRAAHERQAAVWAERKAFLLGEASGGAPDSAPALGAPDPAPAAVEPGAEA